MNECIATDWREIMSANVCLFLLALKDRRVIWRSELTHMRANGKSERYELRVVTCRRKRTNFTPDAAKLIRIASSLLFLFSARPSAYFLHC